MFSLTTSSVVDALIVVALGAGALWRGYRRRREYWSRESWISFGLTMLLGAAMLGVTFYLSADMHRPWMGAPRSGTHAAWILVMLPCLVGGAGALTLGVTWFAQGNPAKPFRPSRLAHVIRAAYRNQPAEHLFDQNAPPEYLRAHDSTEMSQLRRSNE